MTIVKTAGRTDIEEYFAKSGVFSMSKLNQTPFLVFVISDNTVEVSIVDSADQLLLLPDDTPVMGQWRGEWRSDFFQFKVGDYRVYQQKTDEPLKTATNVIKIVGPQGGLRNFVYDYVNEQGVRSRNSSNDKVEVARLEAFFAKLGIEIQIQRIK
jgi:hypothetical protein